MICFPVVEVKAFFSPVGSAETSPALACSRMDYCITRYIALQSPASCLQLAAHSSERKTSRRELDPFVFDPLHQLLVDFGIDLFSPKISMFLLKPVNFLDPCLFWQRF